MQVSTRREREDHSNHGWREDETGEKGQKTQVGKEFVQVLADALDSIGLDIAVHILRLIAEFTPIGKYLPRM